MLKLSQTYPADQLSLRDGTVVKKNELVNLQTTQEVRHLIKRNILIKCDDVVVEQSIEDIISEQPEEIVVEKKVKKTVKKTTKKTTKKK
jgi:hypothetical protein